MVRIRLNNLGGIIMCNDLQLISFKFKNDELVEATILSHAENPMPLEFQRKTVITDRDLRNFFDARITPDTRIGIHEALAKTKIAYYDPERMIRYNNGRCIHDWYWVKCDDDETCWM